MNTTHQVKLKSGHNMLGNGHHHYMLAKHDVTLFNIRSRKTGNYGKQVRISCSPCTRSTQLSEILKYRHPHRSVDRDGSKYPPESCDRGPVFRKSTIPSMEEVVPFIFQFPPTKNFLSRAAMIDQNTSSLLSQTIKKSACIFTFAPNRIDLFTVTF